MQKVICLILLVCLPFIAANTCGGNCPSNDCSSCPCGTGTAPVDIAAQCARGPWNQACCECIIRHESGGNSHALNENSNGSFDVGLWQVNSMNWGVCNGGHAPCDVDSNLKCAIDVYNWGGHNFHLWSTCHFCAGCC